MRILRRCTVAALVPTLAACSLIHPRPTLVAGGNVAVSHRPRPVQYIARNGEKCSSVPVGPVEIASGGEVQCTAPGADTLTRGPSIEPAKGQP